MCSPGAERREIAGVHCTATHLRVAMQLCLCQGMLTLQASKKVLLIASTVYCLALKLCPVCCPLQHLRP